MFKLIIHCQIGLEAKTNVRKWDLQVKLFSALQEKEIERIGGKDVINTNVQTIAAANRDLQKEVESVKFGAYLY